MQEAVDENVPYGSANGTPLLLDVYRPAGHGSLHPAAVLIHGGGWSHLDKSTMRNLGVTWLALAVSPFPWTIAYSKTSRPMACTTPEARRQLATESAAFINRYWSNRSNRKERKRLQRLPIIFAMRFPLFLVIACCVSALGQQPATDNSQPKPAPVISPTARLQNAKTIFLKQIAGNDLAFEVVNNAMSGWPRYIVVDSLEKADLLMEISAPASEKKDDSSKTSVQGNSGGGRDPRAMTMPPPTFSDTDVKLIVRDPHTKAVLWSGREPAKEAFRQAKTDENLMEAAQKLVHKFQDRVEPPPTTPQQ